MTEKKTSWSFLSLFWRGIIMGIADLIPGVSGGTIAFITGIYDDLLTSLKSINPSHFIKKEGRSAFKKERLFFLIALGSGIATSFFVLAHFFYSLLTHPFYYSFLYALFFGLIIASITICLKEVRAGGSRWKIKEWTALISGIIIAAVLSFLPKNSVGAETYRVPLSAQTEIAYEGTLINYDKKCHALECVHTADIDSLFKGGFISAQSEIFHEKSQNTALVGEIIAKKNLFHWVSPLYIVSGMVAISAMLLPGISGSYMLTVIGVYPVAIHSFVSFTEHLKRGVFDSHSFWILLNLLSGIFLGLIVFSRVVSYLLNRFRQSTLIVLIGFMVGSLPCIWPFWHVEYLFSPSHLKVEMVLTNPVFPSSFEVHYLGLIFMALFGFFLVWAVEKISSRDPIISI